MKFEAGKHYNRPGLFGPNFLVTCMSIVDKKAAFNQKGYEHEPETEWEWINIETDPNGVEICECWDYSKHKGYIRADE